MAGGRPLKFKSVKELQEKIDAYFAECDPHIVEEEYVESKHKDGELVSQEVKFRKVKTKQVPYTITGLALALGTTRDLILDYEEKDEFSDTIKTAKQKCHNFAERKLFEANATGSIFNLKNNYGWKDRTEVEADLNVKDVDVTDKQIEQLLKARRNRTDS